MERTGFLDPPRNLTLDKENFILIGQDDENSMGKMPKKAIKNLSGVVYIP